MEKRNFLALIHALGIFDLFEIGFGPSNSHILGPIDAARVFAFEMVQKKAY